MELSENGCLKIFLSAQDLDDLDLRFEDMDYADPATRTALQVLLEQAEDELRFDCGASLLIEALPVEEGCLLLITPAPVHRRLRPRRAAGPAIYAVEDVDALFQLAAAWRRQFRAPPAGDAAGTIGELASSLYALEGGYRLIVYDQPPGGAHILAECARPAGEGDLAAAYIAEHGQPLAIGDALDRLICADSG